MAINAYTIENYVPWLAPSTPTNSPFVYDGENFAWDAQGVHSAWGKDYKFTVQVNAKEIPATFIVDDKPVVVSGGTVYDWATGNAAICKSSTFSGGDLDCAYPWSMTFVGCTWVLSHPCYPLYMYDKRVGSWITYRDPSWRGRIWGVAELDNRLLVCLDDTIAWSAIDDPTDFDCSRTTGAGFQALNLVRYGKPLRLMSAPNDVAYLFTSAGIQTITTATGSPVYTADNTPVVGFAGFTFAHSPIEYGNHPVGAGAITFQGNVPIWISGRGVVSLGQQGPELAYPDLCRHIVKHIGWDCNARIAHVPCIDSLFIKPNASAKTFVVQQGIQKIGTLSHNWLSIDDAALMDDTVIVEKNGQVSVLSHCDCPGKSKSWFVTGGLRLIEPGGFSGLTRKVRSASYEIFEDPQAKDLDYTLCASTSCDGVWNSETERLLEVDEDKCGGGCESVYRATLVGTYHILKFKGCFHINGFYINGKFAGRIDK